MRKLRTNLLQVASIGLCLMFCNKSVQGQQENAWIHVRLPKNVEVLINGRHPVPETIAENRGVYRVYRLEGLTPRTSYVYTVEARLLREGGKPLVAVPRRVSLRAGETKRLRLADSEFKQPAVPSLPELIPDSDRGRSHTDNVTNATTPTFVGTAEPELWVELLSDARADPLGKGQANSTGDWTISLVRPLASGSHSLRARAKDAAGNLSEPSAALSLTIDDTAPSLAIKFPFNGGRYNASGWDAGCIPGGAICGTALDTNGAGLDKVEASIRQSSTGLYWNGSAFASKSEIFFVARRAKNWSLVFPGRNFLQDAAYSVHVRAKDIAGNVEDSPAVTFAIDNTPPAAPSIPDLADESDTGSSNKDNITHNTVALRFTGTAEPDSTVELYEGTKTLGATKADTHGDWSITIPPQPEGKHNITARAKDMAGNVSLSTAALGVTVVK